MFSTLSFFPISLAAVLFPLNENDEVREATRSPSTLASALMSSSLIPSQKYSWSLFSLRSRNGSTAMLFSGGGELVVRSRWRKNGNVSARAAAKSKSTKATDDRAQRSHKGAAARC